MNSPLNNQNILGEIFSFNLDYKIPANRLQKEYIEALQEFCTAYIRYSGTTLRFFDFFNQCLAKGYPYANFASAFVEWSKKYPPQGGDNE